MSTAGPLMAEIKDLVMDVANNRAIARGIVQQLHAPGAEIARSEQGRVGKDWIRSW